MRQAFPGLCLLVFAHLVQLTSAIVVLKPFAREFSDLPAKFAIAVNSSGICGALLISDPLDACSSLRNGLRPNETDKTRFALIVRGECAFKDKVQNAQNAGFHGAIVYDDRDKGKLVYMMIESVNITIHAVFVSKASGEVLKEHALGEEGECCIFPFQNETAWTVLAISFISFLVILGILIIAIFAPRHWLYSQGRNQLPKSVDTKIVEALPCFTFSSSGLGECHSEDTCAICLENYKDEEILKVLPCQHDQKKDLVVQLVNGKNDLSSSGSEVVTIDVQAAKDLLKSGYGYVDVRTVEEYKKGHVDAEKILNIPYLFNTPEGRVKNPQFLQEVSSACNKEDLLVVGCQSGVRSLSATTDLLTAGFKQVNNMGGGYLAWVEHHFPVTKPEDAGKKDQEVDQRKKAEDEL
ncbi:hypothetical protein GBA52_025703 [Prunus armeniaca]|nr:hypothetical protein GBA52_025703 [Prunus armeniaca]